MERLTKRSDTGHAYYPRCFEEACNRRCEDCLFDETICKRLAAYEDTGLEPEEVSALIKDWSDLRTTIGECGGIDRLRELAEADKNGRVVMVPCKVGDTVWAASGKIIKCEIDEMYLCNSGGVEFLVSFNCGGADCKRCPFNDWTQDCSGECYCDCEYGSSSFKNSDIGKTVFLTREEAEKALEAMVDG